MVCYSYRCYFCYSSRLYVNMSSRCSLCSRSRSQKRRIDLDDAPPSFLSQPSPGILFKHLCCFLDNATFPWQAKVTFCCTVLVDTEPVWCCLQYARSHLSSRTAFARSTGIASSPKKRRDSFKCHAATRLADVKYCGLIAPMPCSNT